jgi:large subunit ribosomal protein L35
MAKKLKIKTHRGAAKRFKRTKSGKFLRGKAFKQHILSSKSKKRKRRLRGTATVADVDVPKLRRMLPYK